MCCGICNGLTIFNITLLFSSNTGFVRSGFKILILIEFNTTWFCIVWTISLGLVCIKSCEDKLLIGTTANRLMGVPRLTLSLYPSIILLVIK